MNRLLPCTLVAATLGLASGHLHAQDHARHPGMAHPQGHAGHAGHGEAPEPATPVPPVTAADRTAAFPVLQRPMEHPSPINTHLLFDRLEAWDAGPGTGQAWELEGWIGTDLDRLWLRSGGERSAGSTQSADIELLYGRSISPWWDVVAGLRHEFQPGATRDWLAFGIQGLAPYRVELQATALVDRSGRSALSMEAEYELLLTNRLVLQPVIEVALYGKDDPARGIGSGLATAQSGLRLRYELSRRFAPYVGVTHERAFGTTADLRGHAGEPVHDTRLVAGVRFWF
ncbi:copper resistance protein B [Lysobacter sp. GX 14042]|uniref:copper resistance protein B n=1 Tax=Lysobacter sp. GX 14042 TaxID=2907155 RepID=UPI001F316E36|nr:copper resistance protein B [Lysobacter sp. GX 14042]MCE7031560.1 copper resistance protein B [Lysobacter sp. GX 14042]